MAGTVGTIEHNFSPNDKVYVIEYCKDLKVPVIVGGTVYRIDARVKLDAGSVAPVVEINYVIRTEYSQSVVVEDVTGIFSELSEAVVELETRLNNMATA